MPPDKSVPATLNGRIPVEHELTAKAVLAAYKRMAPVYDWLFGLCFQTGRRRAIEALAPVRGERVLEVGVGTGLSLPHWNAEAEVVGVDLSPDMLARAQRAVSRDQLRNVKLHLMDAQATNFPDDHFDKVAAMYVVSVVPDLGALLREIRRVCKPGGRIAIVNHFEQRLPMLRYCERALANYAGLLGFNSALPLNRVTEAPGLRVRRVASANWGGYWTLIEAENAK